MNLLLVMTGGALGAGARHLVARTLPTAPGTGFPYATLIVNVTGGLAMGILAGLFARGLADEPSRLFLGTGLLGGFTTFSAFSLEAVTLAQRGQPGMAAAYVFLSVVGAIGAVVLGLAMVRMPA